mmetsp:Transcript_31449/g.43785  ORF Transcript_31449/g.43785 Transcript_31449/m.43785 type:complete len:101 (+) Transcript_31449:1049-1351(+)
MMMRHLQHHGLLGTISLEIQDSGASMEAKQNGMVDMTVQSYYHRMSTAGSGRKISRRKGLIKCQKQFATQNEVVHVILGSYRHLIAFPQNISCTVVALSS